MRSIIGALPSIPTGAIIPASSSTANWIEGVDPREVVPGGIVDFLLLAPECVHFSRARGGKPMSPQSRAGIYHTLRWCDSLYVRNILIENVREI